METGYFETADRGGIQARGILAATDRNLICSGKASLILFVVTRRSPRTDLEAQRSVPSLSVFLSLYPLCFCCLVRPSASPASSFLLAVFFYPVLETLRACQRNLFAQSCPGAGKAETANLAFPRNTFSSCHFILGHPEFVTWRSCPSSPSGSCTCAVPRASSIDLFQSFISPLRSPFGVLGKVRKISRSNELQLNCCRTLSADHCQCHLLARDKTQWIHVGTSSSRFQTASRQGIHH